MLHKLAKANPAAAQRFIACLDDNVEAVKREPGAQAGEGQFAVSQDFVLGWLNHALALEYESWLTYFTFGNVVRGLWRSNIAEMFFEHADQELEHAKKLLLWLTALDAGASPGAKVDVSFTTSIRTMILTLHHQEQEALAHYRKGLELAGTKEGFRQMIETIIEQEQEHSNELIVLTKYPGNSCQGPSPVIDITPVPPAPGAPLPPPTSLVLPQALPEHFKQPGLLEELTEQIQEFKNKP